MKYVNLKEKAVALFSEARFISRIHNEAEYEQALELMDELIEDYDRYLPLIEVLSVAIEKWEDESEEFSEFNRRIEALDDGVAILRTLMDQYHLKADDLKTELGSKSLVSMILNGTRNLTRDHIQALSERFKISPSVFFHKA
ncbi:type II toxin-antitoxin system HigA family antitoxin [Endozoicomonas sp. SCSIO W0465]|uniref:helix-turn-helix domain-containing protein n=1 Tax=Endozoicomonas sp. SCSIO W0465 TaxID=2918516 RepID=UPI002075EAEE|nr:helix-turn-helix domain-containing protein [Endozoicomonas sp. SCSIO W0465]USE34123.1 helix-turn-helix domain-containing protein [Endozoicomonas sp. SCSIO W0465]